MAYLKNIKSNLDPQAFPGATFELTGTVPVSQCSEAKIEGADATTQTLPGYSLKDPGAFAGFALAGKVCTITASVGGNTGDFDIDGNTDDLIALIQDPGVGDPVEYYVHNGAELILTRDIPSFAQFIHDAGYAYTIKGAKLYTDIPSGQLKDACTILFDPLT